jgi:hypothetical protein
LVSGEGYLFSSCHDHLTREHAETPHIVFVVLKHRQVPIDVTNPTVLDFYGDPILISVTPAGNIGNCSCGMLSLINQVARRSAVHFLDHSDFIDVLNLPGRIRSDRLPPAGGSLKRQKP